MNTLQSSWFTDTELAPVARRRKSNCGRRRFFASWYRSTDMAATVYDNAWLWNDLKDQVMKVTKHLKKRWHQNFPRVVLSWPSDHFMSSDKKIITHVVSYAVKEKEDLLDAAVLVARKTNAYAILVMDRKDNRLRLRVESPIGAGCWDMPIERQADVYRLTGEVVFSEKGYEKLQVLQKSSSSN